TKQMTRYFALLLFIVAGFSFHGIREATSGERELFSARGISVDVTAGSASEARIYAIAQGQQRAFKAMMRKLVPLSYHDDLPELTDAEITSLVTGIQVSKEKTSQTRYLADLTVEFRPDRIRPILEANDLPYAETRSKPVLVLPVFDTVGSKNLWEEPNPWRDAWLSVFEGGEGPEGNQKRQDDWAQERIVPVLVGSGSLEDIRSISAEEAVNLDAEALARIAEMYGAGTVLVAYASMQDQGGVRRLDVSYQYSNALTPAVVESFTGGDTDLDIFKAAIFDVVSNLQENWKDQNVLDRSIQNRIAVSSTVEGLQQWMEIQNKAQSVPAIHEIKVRELAVDKAFWEIGFYGEINQLKGALAQRDLILENIDGYWMLETQPLE
ncbi:MAG: DUF2066 domain-containing protein, partial [Sneathiellales bacterium]|nr:DUF2066 domain-containing protein [Sneathiellales bacterium]